MGREIHLTGKRPASENIPPTVFLFHYSEVCREKKLVRAMLYEILNWPGGNRRVYWLLKRLFCVKIQPVFTQPPHENLRGSGRERKRSLYV